VCRGKLRHKWIYLYILIVRFVYQGLCWSFLMALPKGRNLLQLLVELTFIILKFCYLVALRRFFWDLSLNRHFLNNFAGRRLYGTRYVWDIDRNRVQIFLLLSNTLYLVIFWISFFDRIRQIDLILVRCVYLRRLFVLHVNGWRQCHAFRSCLLLSLWLKVDWNLR